MFECTLEQGEIFRKIITAIQDLVTDGNLQINGDSISLQGMDSSHVSLVNLILRKEGFKGYRADKDLTLGINFQSLGKILKCMGSKDRLSIRTEDGRDSALFIFESPNEKRLSNFELKLMDIDAEQLGIPETEYKAVVRMSSSQFQRICRDLSAIGETVTIAVTKEGVKFSVQGEIGSGDMTLKQSSDENVDETLNTDSEKKEKDDDSNGNVMIELEEPIQQTFALRYLNSFTKATTLSKTVTLSLGPEVPLVVEYSMDNLGEIRYYLAPKIDDEE